MLTFNTISDQKVKLMDNHIIQIILAEDDSDDCLLFTEALSEIDETIRLTVVNNGVKLMELLHGLTALPTLIFTDLNMPLKNGMECIQEIRESQQLKSLPVIVFSTYFDTSMAEKLHRIGATHYFVKPNAFHDLKSVIRLAITTITDPQVASPNSFVLNP